MALVALAQEKLQDNVMGVGVGNSAEARGTLVNRSDLVVAGSIRALLKFIITPETCRIEDFIEKVEAMYESKNDEKIRKRQRPTDDDS